MSNLNANVMTIDLNNVNTIDACIDNAQTDKGSLITLVNVFAICQENREALTQMITSDAWTEQVNTTFWNESWDGDFDKLIFTISEAFNKYYPLY
ncbi:hypothetical protein M3194_15690 [Paenibacillus glycanilyticus]|uniref:hypothetical protein n=1 Tax=Paenibacillus glycanilyticus TaxID=126569 RepID=UPI00204156D2|nr:hypothetical protein [Paenibacillus glycanilyticus]MCM3628786.1 hypothetical protein [Paenibacillus glycanilyticus]